MPMKMILLERVPSLGEPGQVVEVSPGYARNFLVPRKLAVEATPGNLKTLEMRRRALTKRAREEEKTAQELAARLSQVTVTIPARVGEAGRLHGTITHEAVAEAIAAQHGIEVDRRHIEFEEPIKVVGAYEVKVRLPGEAQAKVNVEVLPEE